MEQSTTKKRFLYWFEMTYYIGYMVDVYVGDNQSEMSRLV